ncbi:hypothetical protein AGMMS50284_5130 [Clostridia bacterium]|nr:hypothetical protein AGMMS50284_5130 [Clostridia bacterium]
MQIYYYTTDNMNQNNIFQLDKIYPDEKTIKRDIDKEIMLLGVSDGKIISVAAIRMYEKLGYKKVGKMDIRKGLFYLYEKKL